MCAWFDVKMRNPEVGRSNLVQREYTAFDLREPPGPRRHVAGQLPDAEHLGLEGRAAADRVFVPAAVRGGQVEAACFAQSRSRSRRVIRSWASGEPSWKVPIHLSSCGRLSPP